jgi:transcription termination/antitermination protein NusA
LATAMRGTSTSLKNDFLQAITQLAAEKNLPKEVVFEAVEAALASAYKKDNLANMNLVVKIDANTGGARVFAQKAVVEEVEDAKIEMTLAEARQHNPNTYIGDAINIEVTPESAGRIAAQTAKQVVLQRLREAEREVVFEEYSGKEGDIVSGVVHRLEARHVYIDLGKTEAVLPPSEQVRIEHYRPGQRLKVYLLEVHKANRGPQVTVSRTHKNLLRRLFELEVPEIFKGSVEIKAIAREPGFRSKVAVWSRQEGVDAVGACVGLRGIRIQNIVNELNGERIDVVQWDPDSARFVANALSPAQVHRVRLLPEDNTAEVIVADRQLSLAIGKEGQNARLAAKLTGLRIDIKSLTAAEEEEAALPPTSRMVAEPEVAREAPVWAEVAEPEAPAEAPEAEEEATELAAGIEEDGRPAAVVTPPQPAAARPPALRFAEEVLPSTRPDAAKGKKAKSKGKAPVRETEEQARARRAAAARRGRRPFQDIEEELEALGDDEDLDLFST